MKNIGFFINNTITKKNIDINIHNIKILHNNFEEIHIIDERNDYSEILSIKFTNGYKCVF